MPVDHRQMSEMRKMLMTDEQRREYEVRERRVRETASRMVADHQVKQNTSPLFGQSPVELAAMSVALTPSYDSSTTSTSSSCSDSSSSSSSDSGGCSE